MSDFDPLASGTRAPAVADVLAQALGQDPGFDAPVRERTPQQRLADSLGVTPGQLDPDPLGLVTEREGKRMGMDWTRDSVEGVVVGNKFVPRQELEQIDGGLALLDLAQRQRQGRRGFWEGLTQGAATDFVPFVGDLASYGVSVRNMGRVRDSLKKAREQGWDSMSLQEQVDATLFMADMDRQASSTWHGTAGQILRQAPAFGAEFWVMGGLGRVALGALGLRETAEKVAAKTAMSEIKREAYNLAKAGGRANVNIGDSVIAGIAKKHAQTVARTADGGVDAGVFMRAENAATKAMTTYMAGYKNPKRVAAVADFVSEFVSRGFLEHGGDITRTLPPGVRAKLREAAGTLLFDVPIKGGIYAAFDFAGVNPVAARVLGAEEAVTRAEVAYSASPDADVRKNAEMMALGSAWAEYASETSGRAFSAVGGIVADKASEVLNVAARRGLRAVAADAKAQGSHVAQVIEHTLGGDDAVKKGLKDVLADAYEADRRVGGTLSQTPLESLGRPEQTELVKRHLGLRDRSFLGYWVATKMADTGITPVALAKAMENMGYDEILGEFMEERYNGFLQGLYGLDGQGKENEGLLKRLAHAAKSALPDTSSQAFAEIVAFAVPSVVRAAAFKTFDVAGAGVVGKANAAVRGLDDYVRGLRGAVVYEDESGRIAFTKAPETARPGDEGARVAAALGGVDLTQDAANRALDYNKVKDLVKDLGASGRDMEEGRAGLDVKVARAVMGAVNFAVTGNPALMFHDPVRAAFHDGVGRDGQFVYGAATAWYRHLYNAAVAKSAAAAAERARARLDRGEAADPADSGTDDAKIKEQIAGDYDAAVDVLLKSYLAARGVLQPSAKAVDAVIDGFGARDGTWPGGLSRAEFKDKYKSELADVVRGNMVWDETGGRGQFKFVRVNDSETSAVARAIESVMAAHGVESFTDAGVSPSPRTAWDAYGVDVDADVIDRAAAGDTSAQIAFAFATGVNLSDSAIAMPEAVLQRASDSARVIRAMLTDVLRTQYETDAGARAGISRDAAGVSVRLDTGAVESYPGLAEADAALRERGFRPSRYTIKTVPYASVWAPHASAFLHRDMPGSAAYLKSANAIQRQILETSPYADPGLDFAGARAKAAQEIADAAARGEVPEWEQVAREVGTDVGIRPRQHPSDRSRAGYFFAAGALSDAATGNVYLPQKLWTSAVFAVEDSLEAAHKRNPSAMLMPDGSYRPAVKAFFDRIREAASARYAALVAGEPGLHQKRLAESVYRLIELFNPETPNIEAISKAPTALLFFYGDAARRTYYGTGAVLYPGLGEIASDVRADLGVLADYAGAVRRLLGGAGDFGTDTYTGFAATVRDTVPAALRDYASVTPESGPSLTPMNLVPVLAQMSEERRDPKGSHAAATLARSRNLNSEQARVLEQAEAEIRADVASGFFNAEDFAALMEEQVRAFASVPETADEAVAADAVDPAPEAPARVVGTAADDDFGNVSTSAVEDSLLDAPALSLAFALARMPAANPGDTDSEIERAFRFWRQRYPGLREDVLGKWKQNLTDAKIIPADAGTEDEDEARAEDLGPEGTVASYNDNRNAIEIEREPHLQFFFAAVMEPADNGSRMRALERIRGLSRGLHPRGSTDSLASLLEPWPGGLHPAFKSDEAWDAWVKIDRAEAKDPGLADAWAAIKALGKVGAFNVSDRVKALWQARIFTINKPADGHANVFDDTMRGSVDTISNLVRGVKSGTPDPERARSLLRGLGQGVDDAKLDAMADAAEALFGRGNEITAALRRPEIRDMIRNRIASGGAAGNVWATWFSYYSMNGAGIIALRLQRAAEALGRGATAEAAVSSLMRGDAIDRALVQKLGVYSAPNAASDRGAMATFLNAVAGRDFKTSGRRPGHGLLVDRKVRAQFPGPAAGVEGLVRHPAFQATLAGLSPERAEAAARTLTHADGTPVLAVLRGLTRVEAADVEGFDDVVAGEKTVQGNPSPEEVYDLLRNHYDSGAGDYVYIAVDSADKSRDLVLTWPRRGLRELARVLAEDGSESAIAVASQKLRGYDAAVMAAAKLLRVTDVTVKRSWIYLAGGQGQAFENLGVTVLDIGEVLNGAIYLSGGDAAEYARLQGFGETSKHIYTHNGGADTQVFAGKGQTMLPFAKPELQDRAWADVATMAADIVSGLGHDVIVTDLDSVKASPLTQKSVMLDGKKVSPLEAIRAGVDTNTPVETEAGTTSLSQMLPGLDVREVTVNGNRVRAVSWLPRGGLRVQKASSAGKEAMPGPGVYNANTLRDNPESLANVTELSNLARAWHRIREASGQVGTVAQRVFDSLPDSMKRFISAGGLVADPEVARAYAAKAASELAKPGVAGTKMPAVMEATDMNEAAVVAKTEAGDIRWDEDKAFPVIDSPLGRGSDLTYTEYVFTDTEQERFRARVRFASVRVNNRDPWHRYDLGVNPEALGTDEAGVMEALEARFMAWANKDGDAALEYLAREIMPAFTTADGKPLKPGQVFGFGDVFVKNGAGDFVFDRTCVRDGGDARVVGDKRIIIFSGTKFWGGRTPSDGEKSGAVFTSAAPATVVESNGRGDAFYMAAEIVGGKTRARKVKYAAGDPIPGPEAVWRKDPVFKAVNGSDEDGDKTKTLWLKLTRFGQWFRKVSGAREWVEAADGKELTRRAIAAVDAAAAKVAADPGIDAAAKARTLREAVAAANDVAKTARLRDAESRYRAAWFGEANEIWHGIVARYRNMPVTRVTGFPPAPAGARYSTLGTEYRVPVKANPYTREHMERELGPGTKHAAVAVAQGSPQAFTRSFWLRQSAIAKGKSVKAMARAQVAMGFGVGFGGSAAPVKVLQKPESATAEYWDRAGAMALTPRQPPQGSVKTLFMSVAGAITNATFDEIKDMLASRAGFRPWFIDIYVGMVYALAPATQADYEAFDSAFREWADSGDGAAIDKHFRWRAYRARYGGSEYGAQVEAMEASIREDAKNAKAGDITREYAGLGFDQKQAVLAVAVARGGIHNEACAGLMALFKRQNLLADIDACVSYRATEFGDSEKFDAAAETAARVLAYADSPAGYGLVLDGRGAEMLRGAAKILIDVLADVAPAHSSNPDRSRLFDATNADYAKTPPPYENRGDWIRRLMSEAVCFDAALAMTPAATWAKIKAFMANVATDVSVAGDGRKRYSEGTEAFAYMTEAAFRALWRRHAAGVNTGDAGNAAVMALMGPGRGSGAKTITFTASGDQVRGLGDIEAGFEEMRTWTPAQKSALGPVTVRGWNGFEVEVTPADFYHMLMMYAAMTAPKSLEAGQGRSILAGFGDGVLAQISDYQILNYDTVDLETVARIFHDEPLPRVTYDGAKDVRGEGRVIAVLNSAYAGRNDAVASTLTAPGARQRLREAAETRARELAAYKSPAAPAPEAPVKVSVKAAAADAKIAPASEANSAKALESVIDRARRYPVVEAPGELDAEGWIAVEGKLKRVLADFTDIMQAHDDAGGGWEGSGGGSHAEFYIPAFEDAWGKKQAVMDFDDIDPSAEVIVNSLNRVLGPVFKRLRDTGLPGETKEQRAERWDRLSGGEEWLDGVIAAAVAEISAMFPGYKRAKRELAAGQRELPLRFAAPVVGENLATKGRGGSALGSKLTNMTQDPGLEISDVPGLVKPTTRHRPTASMLSAENWYVENKSKAKGAQADTEDLSVMTRIIEAKLRQHPDLVSEIRAKGGRTWLAASQHTVLRDANGNPSPRKRETGWTWEGQGLGSGFIRALDAAYAAVTGDKVSETPESSALALVKAYAVAAAGSGYVMPTALYLGRDRARARVAADAGVRAAADAAALALERMLVLPWAQVPEAAAVVRAGAALIRDIGFGSDIGLAVMSAAARAATRAGRADASSDIMAQVSAAGLKGMKALTANWPELMTRADDVFGRGPEFAVVAVAVSFSPKLGRMQAQDMLDAATKIVDGAGAVRTGPGLAEADMPADAAAQKHAAEALGAAMGVRPGSRGDAAAPEVSASAAGDFFDDLYTPADTDTTAAAKRIASRLIRDAAEAAVDGRRPPRVLTEYEIEASRKGLVRKLSRDDGSVAVIAAVALREWGAGAEAWAYVDDRIRDLAAITDSALAKFLSRGLAEFAERARRGFAGPRSPAFKYAMKALGNHEAEAAARFRAEDLKPGADAAVLTRLYLDYRRGAVVARALASAGRRDSEAAPAPEARTRVKTAAAYARAAAAARGPELQAYDPETCEVSGYDRWRMTPADADAFVAGAVTPFYRGFDHRKILLNKDALAALSQAVSVANAITNALGIASASGFIPVIQRRPGSGFKPDSRGGWTHAEAGADVTRYVRRKAVAQASQAATGAGHSDAEFADAHYYAQICFSHMKGDPVFISDVPLSFSDLPWQNGPDSLPELTAEYAVAAEAQKPSQLKTYQLHKVLRTARDRGVDYVYNLAHEALVSAAAVFADAAKTASSSEAGNAAALEYLESRGYAVVRRGANGAITGAVATVPTRAAAEAFKATSAYEKLVKAHGRTDADIGLEAVVAKALKAVRAVNDTARGQGLINGDARMFHDAGSAVYTPRGRGAFRYNSRKAERAETPVREDAFREKYESLLLTLRRCFKSKKVDGGFVIVRDSAGLPIPKALGDTGEGQRMLQYLIDLHRGTMAPGMTPSALLAEIRAGRHADGHAGFRLGPGATRWDVASAVYAESQRLIAESAARGGAAPTTRLGDTGLADFNRAIEIVSAESGADALSPKAGVTDADIYRVTGQLPEAMGIDEAVHAHAVAVANAVRYRVALTQMLFAADESGMPVVYMKPGAEGDDTIPDAVWAQTARWWAQVHAGADGKGAYYDETRSGRENAIRLFDEIEVGKDARTRERGSSYGFAKNLFHNVKVPDGVTAVSAVKALAPASGDPSQSLADVAIGGSAAGIMEQLLALRGFSRDDGQGVILNRVLTWSKSASVMASFFFPLATAGESPVAVHGMSWTLAGLSSTVSQALRKKGLFPDAPGMKEVMDMIGSDDPALVDAKVQALLSGLSLADRAKNMTDHDRTQLARDIDSVSRAAADAMGARAGRNIRSLLEAMMDNPSEAAFEYVINATKIATFLQMSHKLRAAALARGRWWDPIRDMQKWAPYINAEIGGIDPAMYAWATPKALGMLKALMFSWEWTLGAWEAGGGGVLTRAVFGSPSNRYDRGFMFGRWLRMYGTVMFGVPVALQLLITAMAKAAGEDDDDDKWWTWQNEGTRKWFDFDLTPMLRMIANAHVIPGVESSPTWGQVKDAKIPVVSALIPALTGDEGEMVSTRARRYYMHFGKQGWEVAGWFENPARSFLGKMSMPAQRVLEGVLGVTPATGWEKPFADLGFWERWLSLDPETSASLNLLGSVMPFSVASLQRSPETGALAMFGPTGKGMSKTRAKNEMAAMFKAWGDSGTYYADLKGRPGAMTDLMARSTEWLEALRLNGYPPLETLKNAIAEARKPLYEAVHKALPRKPGDTGDRAALERAARGLIRLNYVEKNLVLSIRSRDKAQHIARAGDLGALTEAMLVDAFRGRDPGSLVPDALRRRD